MSKRGACCLVLAGMATGVLGGCGASGDSAPDGNHSAGTSGHPNQTSTQPVSTQPERPCMRVPQPVIQQITELLNPNINVQDVWQIVHANKVHELGLDNPYFISARAKLTGRPTTYASWTLQDLKQGTVIPLDGTAKSATEPQKGIDPDAYEDLVNNNDYTQSRGCAQAQFELEQEAGKDAEP
jgi:hypothetical protein